MEPIETKKSQRSGQKYYCNICDYYTFNKTDYNKHLTTIKHTKRENNATLKHTETEKNEKLTCACGIIFKSRTTLWRHKKSCIEIKDNEQNYEEQEYSEYENVQDQDSTYDLQDKDTLIIQLLKQNGDLQKSLIELSKEKNITTSNSHNTNNTNCHNKQFNLNFFLNETCKDALNMSEFVDLIKPTLEDLENTGRKGYVEGITDLIMKTLKALEQCKRPIHCSDLKRAVLYVKDNDKWEKESEDKPILTNAIKCIAYENIKKIGDWKNKYPDCTQADSRKNDLYLKIVSNAMSGLSEEECSKNMHKIIANLVKETTIQKDMDT